MLLFVLTNKQKINKMVKIIVFDTETTGLPQYPPGTTYVERSKIESNLMCLEHIETTWPSMINNWPHILQLSYIVYDTDTPELSKIFNKYVELAKDVTIDESSISIHHITRAKIMKMRTFQRATIEDVLNEFIHDLSQTDIAIGHNVRFDRQMVVSEFIRLFNNNCDYKAYLELMMNSAKFECTMNATTNLCGLKQTVNYIDKISGMPKSFSKLKSPKLSEAYTVLFGYEANIESLHNALIDVIMCLRIYLKYHNYGDVFGRNMFITRYILRISPPGYSGDIDIKKYLEQERRQEKEKRERQERRSLRHRKPVQYYGF